MAVSNTAKKSNNPNKQQVDQVIVAAAQYISAWTQREFSAISKNKEIPLIWPIESGGYVIGAQRILPRQGYWELQNYHHETKHIFDSKQSAIFYSLCGQVRAEKLAEDILHADESVMKLKNDAVHYESSLERAIKQKNSNSIHVWGARLDDARLRLNLAQKHLQKSIKSAKYLKVWSS